MSAYNNGSVKVTVGSQTVKGTNTEFTTYVSAGDLFRLTDDSGAYYDVAAIVDATDLTLSARYANTSNQTSRNPDNLASGGVSATSYSGNFSYTPVIRNSVIINATPEKFTDDGAGVLTGNASPVGSGTISYDDGAYSITLGTDLTATINISASYYSGDTLSAMGYQIITDYTDNYSLPEMSTADTGIAHIFTKAMRLLDAAINQASLSNVTAASYLNVGATPNYTSLEATHISLHGTAKKWITTHPQLNGEEINKQSKPTLVSIGSTCSGFSLPIYNDDNEELFFKQDALQRWDGSSNPEVNIITALTGNETTDDSFKLELGYKYFCSKGVHNLTIPLHEHRVSKEIVIEASKNATYGIYNATLCIDYDIHSATPMESCDLLNLRLRRISTTATEIANELAIVDVSTKWRINKFGGQY